MELTPPAIFETVPFLGPVSVAFREFDLNVFDRPWHHHPEAELTWILEGSGLRHVGGSVEPFQAGDFCLLGPHLPHAWLSAQSSSSARARSVVVQFDPTRWQETLQLPEMAGIGRLLGEAARGVKFEAELGHRFLSRMTNPTTPLSRFTGLLEILEQLALASNRRSISLAPWSQARQAIHDPRLRRVLTLLGEDAIGQVDQAEVARRVGLNPSAFSRFFKRAMGRTFQSYLNELRLSVAGRQLLETDQQVSEIAFASGFGNLSNFNRRFRERHGMAPREFRRLGSRGREAG